MGAAQLGSETSEQNAKLGPPVSTEISAGASAPDDLPDFEVSDLHYRSDPQRLSALNLDQGDDQPDLLQPQRAARQGGQVITPSLYVTCYKLCRDAIRAVPGHEDDQVLIGAVAPWNNQTAYPGNPNGDWVLYFQDILDGLGRENCDGITIHTYTHQADPNLITSDAKMNPPFQDRHYEFRAYQDFMNAIPADMRHLPVYITETDQDVAWENANIGWVQRAYGEIDYWNRQPGNQQIHALVLYRWPQIDKWYIEGKAGVIEDFRAALVNDYRWRPQIVPNDYEAGTLLATTDFTNLRRTPGYIDQAADDVLTVLSAGARVTVLDDEYQLADSLVWWQVETVASDDQPQSQRGWIAQNTPAGVPLLQLVDDPGDGNLAVGGRARVLTHAYMRNSPGYLDKPAGDVITTLAQGVEGAILSGPVSADDLTWWNMRTIGDDQRPLDGWIAESDPNGVQLLEPAEAVDPPSIPGNGKPDDTFQVGDAVITTNYVRVRRTPGYVGKDEADVVKDVLPDTVGIVRGGPQAADDLTWWLVRLDAQGASVDGWAAEVAPSGVQLLAPQTGPTDPDPDNPDNDQTFNVGELVQAADYLRVRRSPGYVNKPAEDTLGAFAPAATLNIVDGPRDVDGLKWWRVGGISDGAGELIGWVAETAPNGVGLMQHPPKLPNTDIPNSDTGLYLGAPFRERFGISQLWGENPEVYGQFTYDGVPLRGHNGIDFLTPTGTDLLAIDDGVVSEVVYQDLSGFGHYIKLRHGWGESIYAHLNDISVAQGQAVRRGDQLGHTDDTGYSGGPHLHFSIRINPYDRTDGWGGYSDPLPYMDPEDYILPSYVLPWTARISAAPAPASAQSNTSGTGMAPDHPDVTRP